jgi:hypothetical protein
LKLRGLDCVCLFSGGLDSTIGAIDLLAEGRSPLLVSHAYRGDKIHQDSIATQLNGHYSRFVLNAHPLLAKNKENKENKTDTTMRTRSCNFLAFGIVGVYAIQLVNQQEKIELYVPENGFISLNAPLTSRRIGSLSTRTTHPYFIEAIQNIIEAAGIPCIIKNPYQFKTKGEMVSSCKKQPLLKKIVANTVSCSHWKRKNQQCGVCVPCLIRRAALYTAGIQDQTKYIYGNVDSVNSDSKKRDDLMAISIAIKQKNVRKLGPWILDSGPLSAEKFQDYQRVFSCGLDEIKTYLIANRALL